MQVSESWSPQEGLRSGLLCLQQGERPPAGEAGRWRWKRPRALPVCGSGPGSAEGPRAAVPARRAVVSEAALPAPVPKACP